MSSKQKPVVILDDSYEDRFFLKRFLTKHNDNLDFIEFTYASDALSWAQDYPLSSGLFVFVDLNLPRVNGFEFLSRLHELRPDISTQANVIAMSNSIDPEDRERAETMPQVNQFILKPLTENVLISQAG